MVDNQSFPGSEKGTWLASTHAPGKMAGLRPESRVHPPGHARGVRRPAPSYAARHRTHRSQVQIFKEILWLLKYL